MLESDANLLAIQILTNAFFSTCHTRRGRARPCPTPAGLEPITGPRQPAASTCLQLAAVWTGTQACGSHAIHLVAAAITHVPAGAGDVVLTRSGERETAGETNS